MSLLRARPIYLVAMCIAGMAMALLVWSVPAMIDWPAPPLMLLVGVSLVVDLALMGLASAGRIDVLDMNGRVTGFFAGALLYFLLGIVLSRGASITP